MRAVHGGGDDRFETSALSGENLDLAFECLIKKIVHSSDASSSCFVKITDSADGPMNEVIAAKQMYAIVDILSFDRRQQAMIKAIKYKNIDILRDLLLAREIDAVDTVRMNVV